MRRDDLLRCERLVDLLGGVGPLESCLCQWVCPEWLINWVKRRRLRRVNDDYWRQPLSTEAQLVKSMRRPNNGMTQGYSVIDGAGCTGFVFVQTGCIVLGRDTQRRTFELVDCDITGETSMYVLRRF